MTNKLKKINDQLLLEMEEMGKEFITLKNNKLQQDNNKINDIEELKTLNKSLKAKHKRIYDNLEEFKRSE